jgi:hypothetical protein
MQLRFIGYLDDLTQAGLLWMVKALAAPGVRHGLQASVDTSLLQITLQPGFCVLPDGFIVGETEAVQIPIFEPGFGDYSLTLIAKRIVEPGMINDVVTYEVLEGIHGADSLATITNLVRMPLAWIYKVGDAFNVINLGDRKLGEVFYAPFNQIYSTVPTVVGLDAASKLQYRTFSNGDSTLYLTIPDGEAISSVEFTGKCTDNQVLTIRSLNAKVDATTYLTTNLNFRSDVYVTRSFSYPFRTYLFGDILELNFSSNVPLLLSQIRINRLKVFG